MYIHTYISLCCTAEVTMLFNQPYTSIKKKAGGHSQRQSVRSVGRDHSLSWPSCRSSLDRGASTPAGRQAWQRQELAHHCPQTLWERGPPLRPDGFRDSLVGPLPRFQHQLSLCISQEEGVCIQSWIN